jgi:TRAP-type C4-dicarboxylate transport system substrate-binding protein
VVKYAIHPPLASATFAMAMNPAKYKALPGDLRALLDKEAGVNGAVDFGKAWAAQEKFATNLETTKKGLEIVTLPDADVGKLRDLGKKQTDEAIAALEKQGKPARAFFTAYMKP